jgi:DNA polymerase elongation subunit (family B)
MNFYTSVNRYGNSILYRGVENGERVAKKVPFMPTLFVNSSHETGWFNLQNQPVLPKTFDTMRDARDFIKQYDGVDNFTVYGTTNYVTQFINDRYPEAPTFDRDKINVTTIDIEVASDEGFPFVEQAAHPVISITMKNNIDNVYRVWGLYDYEPDDCEVEGVDAIQYIKCKDEIDLLLSWLGYWNSPQYCPDIVTGWNTRLFDFPYLINRVKNIIGGDVYKKFSPWGIVDQRNIMMARGEVIAFEMAGIQQLDYYDLFTKFGYTYGMQESYKLDHIAHVVLGERKLSYDEAGSLHGLYKTNYQKFIDYNIKDVLLVDKFEEKMGLISLAITMAYRGGVNYSETFGTVQIWDSILYRLLFKQQIACPPKISKEKVPYPGAYVKDPQTGMHDWVVSFDLNSLYPMIIVQYNMSPETVLPGKEHLGLDPVEKLLSDAEINIPEGTTMAASGVKFSKDQVGIIPAIIKQYYDERRVIKNKMLRVEQELQNLGKDTRWIKGQLATLDSSSGQQIAANTTGFNERDLKINRTKLENEVTILANQQMSIKILMNSLYGALGNKHFRYFNNHVAEAITTSGQLSIRWAENAINKEMNTALGTDDKDYVIAIDTDSLYVNMNEMVKKFKKKDEDPVEFLDKICREHFEGILEKAYAVLAKKMNVMENRMEMSREVIANRGVWIAKKRYILNVHNNEGVQYAEPKMKMMGVDAVRSSTPQICRDKFKKIFKVIINEGEVATQRFIADFRKEWKQLPPESISFPRGCNISKKKDGVQFTWADPKTIYKKACPIHVRGALLYNHYIKQAGLDQKYELIQNGEKIKFVYLKTPNPMKENIVAYANDLPKELDLHRFIDYNKQYEKAFVEPIRHLLDALEWDVEPVATLEDFFA